MTEPRRPSPDEDPPPLLGTWRRIYTAVAAYLAALIALFALFTRWFAP